MRTLLTFWLTLSWLFLTAQESPGIPGDSSLFANFRVQVGAYKSSTEMKLANFEIVQREISEDSIKRYTVGFFTDLEKARHYRDSLRSEGYSDAFVVCYLNGRRVSLGEIEASQKKIVERDSVELISREIYTETLEEKEEMLEDSLCAVQESLEDYELKEMRQRLNRITWMKIAAAEATIGAAIVLGIFTGAWVPVMMGAAVIEMYLIFEGNYRFNRKDLRKLEINKKSK